MEVLNSIKTRLAGKNDTSCIWCLGAGSGPSESHPKTPVVHWSKGDNGTPSPAKRKSDTQLMNQPAEKKLEKAVESPYHLQAYVAERKGEREEMQDAYVIIENYRLDVSPDASIQQMAYYAVFDGHAGARASQYSARHLHSNLAEKLQCTNVQAVEKEIKRIFIDTFKKTDEDFLKEASRNKPAWKDGTTAVCVLLINETLYIANLGDSKAVLCRNDKPLPLTVDHNPTQYDERIRIQKAGGQVRDGRVLGILEVSRSIGDGPYKSSGVICIPDVKRCKLTDEDRFIIVACDGLWKAFSPEGAIKTVIEVIQDDLITAAEGKTLEQTRFEAACNKLAADSVRRGCGDNVTVILIKIGTH
ncbi:PREDICTED: integrin-linked kinase-associated serine/threonine phosphatase 2C-like [Priapulus caudatus]|uniref:Integrin-linked kinase-associated serine/threonine phosphatase 2C-like n=1 Tax=Priapulus caudatus TaxID=37621 RepID=A0ABM1DR30_PRICU|nr:PREDICTED: integrin-linked kinase-associated serine/threonine phosphatase 2C-like [Priapulus caudatus]